MVYWMQHAQRALDNPAMDVGSNFAKNLASQWLRFWLLCVFIRTLIFVTTGGCWNGIRRRLPLTNGRFGSMLVMNMTAVTPTVMRALRGEL